MPISEGSTGKVYTAISGKLTAYDGAGSPASLELDYVQSDLTWERKGAKYAEAMDRGRHTGTPALMKTGDENVEVSFSLLVKSFLIDGPYTPYEFLTGEGAGSALISVAGGDKYAFRLVFDLYDGENLMERLTFTPTVATSCSYKPDGKDGLATLEFKGTAHMNSPTIEDMS